MFNKLSGYLFERRKGIRYTEISILTVSVCVYLCVFVCVCICVCV